jgi:hypothetical protein
MTLELLAQQVAEADIDGCHHCSSLLNQGHLQAAMSQGICHLQADVAATDDQGSSRSSVDNPLANPKAVFHRVQDQHAVVVDALNCRRDRLGAGPDNSS